MSLLNILYTPLDTPPQPHFDLDKLKQWLADYHYTLAYARHQLSREVNGAEARVPNYPWNMTLCYLNMFDQGPGWIGDFEKIFPELATWMHTAFGLELDDVGSIILLPIKKNHTGFGFMHNDPDWFGLRFYLEYEHIGENKLFTKRTKIPYDNRPDLLLPIDEEKYLQSELIECVPLHNKQCFFLNNVRAAHATYTAVENSTRIAAFVTSKVTNTDKFFEKIYTLVTRSASLYPEHVVLWQPEK